MRRSILRNIPMIIYREFYVNLGKEKKMKKKALLKKRVKALQNASTVLEWTIAVRMAKWGRLMNDNS